VVLRTYGDELSARLDAAVLEANNIPSQVFADTAAGAYPSMALLWPVRLMVYAEDAALARELLDTPVGDAEDAGGADDVGPGPG
jgi:hypothetical protein